MTAPKLTKKGVSFSLAWTIIATTSVAIGTFVYNRAADFYSKIDADRTTQIDRIDHLEAATQARNNLGELRYQELTMSIKKLGENQDISAKELHELAGSWRNFLENIALRKIAMEGESPP